MLLYAISSLAHKFDKAAGLRDSDKVSPVRAYTRSLLYFYSCTLAARSNSYYCSVFLRHFNLKPFYPDDDKSLLAAAQRTGRIGYYG